MKVLAVVLAVLAASFACATIAFPPPREHPPEWALFLYVGHPPSDFVGPMPYWQPWPDAPRIYYRGPSLNPYAAGHPPTLGTMEIIVTNTDGAVSVATEATQLIAPPSPPLHGAQVQ